MGARDLVSNLDRTLKRNNIRTKSLVSDLGYAVSENINPLRMRMLCSDFIQMLGETTERATSLQNGCFLLRYKYCMNS